MEEFGLLFWSLLVLFISGFFILWPVLIWSHLREQTKMLSRIVEILESERNKK